MSKLPLVEGKSLYAEMVCPPLVREYKRVLGEYGGRWPVRDGNTAVNASSSSDGDKEKNQLTQEDVSLNIIRTFVENCSKRSKYERALLEERNALSNSNSGSSLQGGLNLMRRFSRVINDDIASSNAVAASGGGGGKSKGGGMEAKLGAVFVPRPGVPEEITLDLDRDVWMIDEDFDEDGD